MGNCQAATTALTEIQHPEGNIERIYWPIRACHVMSANPGHYVAVIINRRTSKDAVKYLKLLSPEETLLLGNTYHLVTFEEVLREFKSKCHVRMRNLLRKRDKFCTSQSLQMEEEVKTGDKTEKIKKLESEGQEILNNSDFTLRKCESRNHQWKPALQSIEE